MRPNKDSPCTPVTFVNCRKQRLAGMLHGDSGTVGVICCHGMMSDKSGTKQIAVARALAARGIPSLRFDFAGHGESEGRLYDMSYSNRMSDLQAAVEYMTGRGYARLGLFGSSMGGAIALLAAARDERIVAIATLAAVAHPADLFEANEAAMTSWQTLGYVETTQGRIGKDLLDDARQHDVLWAVGVLRAPVLVLHSEDDDTVPVADAHDIATTARNASLELTSAAGHRYANPQDLRPAVDRIASFLEDQLTQND